MIDKAMGMGADMMGGMWDSANKLFKAGLGTIVVAQETTADMYHTLVERGRGMDAGLMSPFARVSETVKNAREQAMTAVEAVNRGFDERMTAMLHTIGIPTRDEIAMLNERLEMLTLSVERLKPKVRAAAQPMPPKVEVKATVKPAEAVKTPEHASAGMKPTK